VPDAGAGAIGFDSEHRRIRFAYFLLGHLPNSRLPQADAPRRPCSRAATWPGSGLSLCDSLRLLDATSVPCTASWQTVQRDDIAG
jgi:hypothetical protein